MISGASKSTQKLGMKLSLRPASYDDKERIFEWTQMPFLIKFSTTGRKVTWEEHCRWFDKVYGQESVKIFIVKYGKHSIGQVRFEQFKGNQYKTTIYLIEEYTGRGLGLASLKNGMDIMLKDVVDIEFIAFVQNDNPASRSLFVKAGFIEIRDFEKIPPDHKMYSYRTKGSR